MRNFAIHVSRLGSLSERSLASGWGKINDIYGAHVLGIIIATRS
jgi:hypothetical protein